MKEVSITVDDGDYFILLGESGAGKSILLELVAGLVKPDSGKIFLQDQEITDEKIQNREIGIVFQDHAVFPHLSVHGNLMYALHGKLLTKKQKELLVNEIAEKLEIKTFLSRRPETLSGGELQRVALGRSLIQKPKILLLDEPLASLDSRRKADLRRLLRKIHREGQTILHVTHDYDEALALGTRIAVMNQGRIIQTGKPDEVFRNPANEFIAGFTGHANFFSASVERSNNATFAIINDQIKFKVTDIEEEDNIFLMIRKEDLMINAGSASISSDNNFCGKIVEVVPVRNGKDIIVDIGIELHVFLSENEGFKSGIEPAVSCTIAFTKESVKLIKKTEK